MTKPKPPPSPTTKRHRLTKPLSFCILTTSILIFILFQMHSLKSSPSWFLRQTSTFHNCSQQLASLANKLRHSVSFLPLKDLRYTDSALEGHTWFMSSLYDSHEEGEVQYQQFPSHSSSGRVLCLKGGDTHDGSWNSYALAWLDNLPSNATLMKGLTFISYNHYNYDNIWHGLSAIVPFIAWHQKNNCSIPSRWILYHRGELRFQMSQWLTTLIEATFSEPIYIEKFNTTLNDDSPICFEKAVVMRHNEGGMARDRRLEVYDLMRCKARIYCNLSVPAARDFVAADGGQFPVIGMTMFMRSRARSFKDERKVIEIFEKECSKVDGCKILVAYSNNLSFCDQVNMMSMTDILVSPHGAQLTNMFLMNRNSSVMEFFPKGWLKLAGVGQFVYHWIASWSGMRHRGAWRDPNGETCEFPDDDRRCMSVYKGGKIGYNETYFSEWAKNVLNDVKVRKMEEFSNGNSSSNSGFCRCSYKG